MSRKKKSNSNSTTPKSKVDILVAKYGLFGVIIAAMIGTVGVIVAAYFGYLGIQTQIKVPINATQTVEARLPLTPSLSQTLTSHPTSTVAPTFTYTPTSTLEPTFTYTPSIILNARTIAITEVMANPCGWITGQEAYWNEYIELYNFGIAPIDVGGWWITDGEDVKGNPDRLIAWNTRFPSQKFGGNDDIKTDTTTIQPGQFALILSPQYLRSENVKTPYLIPSGTVILTIEDGLYLGDDGGGLEVSETLNIVVLYIGTAEYIDQMISTYGTPRLSSSPKNIKDEPSNRDGVPIVLNDCFSAQRQEASGPDADYNWIAIENGTPGSGPYSP